MWTNRWGLLTRIFDCGGDHPHGFGTYGLKVLHTSVFLLHILNQCFAFFHNWYNRVPRYSLNTSHMAVHTSQQINQCNQTMSPNKSRKMLNSNSIIVTYCNNTSACPMTASNTRTKTCRQSNTDGMGNCAMNNWWSRLESWTLQGKVRTKDRTNFKFCTSVRPKVKVTTSTCCCSSVLSCLTQQQNNRGSSNLVNSCLQQTHQWW